MEKNSKNQDYIVVKSKKKSKYRKDKKLPANYDQIDKWKMPEINPQLIKGPFLEESSFATLFPRYREKYIREVFGFVQKRLREFGIKAELDLVEGSMTVKTTKKTWDPYVIIKARDIIKLLARSVPYEVSLRLLEDDTYCEIIKIKSFVRKKDKFIKKRTRLIGPEGSTVKALEILTDTYIQVQGHTVSVIGHYKQLKQVRRIIEGVMKNVHPVFYIKELMIKKELLKNEQLKFEDWDRFLPKLKKTNQRKRKIKKERKERKVFPNEQIPRKIDLQMETGEYFLSEKQREVKDKKRVMREKLAKRQEKLLKRAEQYQEPQQKQQKIDKPKEKKEDIKEVIDRFKIKVKNSLIQLQCIKI